MFSRLGAKESLGDLNLPLFCNAELQPGDVIEFCGVEGTGKSELLLNIAAICILPRFWQGVALPGRNVDVLFVSTDYKFDLVRFVTVMKGIILSHGVLLSDEVKYKELIISSLEHLHIVNCSSMDELVISLYSFKIFLINHPEVCTLLIDNIATFWWTERAENSMSDLYQQRWTCAVNELIREFHLVVIAARPLLTKDMTSHFEKV